MRACRLACRCSSLRADAYRLACRGGARRGARSAPASTAGVAPRPPITNPPSFLAVRRHGLSASVGEGRAPFLYDLYAVVCHRGSYQVGAPLLPLLSHYVPGPYATAAHARWAEQRRAALSPRAFRPRAPPPLLVCPWDPRFPTSPTQNHSQGGHYVTFVRCGDSWFLCDDAWVVPVAPEVVRNCQAYLLFYEQRGGVGGGGSAAAR